ncbi:MAG: hypothetical protein HFP81_06325 [Methylococcales symbiont of Hymedesmia sp. n. MRB-2018]|nr:MAG: hypothetical protein HFP81_06325 [Methylococcales symbiont of Hymedesmia sp. n. MRB-2018]
MADKTISKHLIHLENYFSASNPILHKASNTFQQLDQLEFDLGLLDNEDSTVKKSSWWPIVSLIGGFSTAKSDFIAHYLNANIHSSNHKFTIHQYTPQTTNTTLPGTALDADYRLPFYQTSHKIEQTVKGEGAKINAYLELKTVNSERLKGKLFVDTPVVNPSLTSPVVPVLTQHILDMSDLVLVFTDLFDATPELIKHSIDEIIAQQDTNKFIYVVDHSEISLDSNKTHEIIASWQRRLAELGIHTGQFIVLSDSTQNSINEIEQRLANIENDRSYRVLHSLEKSISDINDVYLYEVEQSLSLWKERLNMSTFIILGFFVTLLLFAEITIGVVQHLFDPIIGPAFILILLAFLVPIHLMMAKVHAKFIIRSLQERQKELDLTENLSGLFEKSLTFWRILLPINEPVGKNKKTRSKTMSLIEQTRDMVQALNNQFSQYPLQDESYPVSSEPLTTTADLGNTDSL